MGRMRSKITCPLCPSAACSQGLLSSATCSKLPVHLVMGHRLSMPARGQLNFPCPRHACVTFPLGAARLSEGAELV